jgi:hypothetical protein
MNDAMREEWRKLREQFLVTESFLWWVAIRHFWTQVAIVAQMQEFNAPSITRMSMREWKWTMHIRWWYAQEWFWGQIAIVAVLYVLHSHDRLLAEVMPIAPPWEGPRWSL